MLDTFQAFTSASLWSSLTSKINSYAKESGLVQRISEHFCPHGFLLSLLGAVSTGRASINQLASSVGEGMPCLQISVQALQQRFARTECGVESFLIRCLSHICQWKYLHLSGHAECPFARIIIEDSTFVRFPKSNAIEFPASGNASGATAGCKVDLAFDLLSGDVIDNELHLGTESDNAIGVDLLSLIRENDLLLRDMGYFGVESFIVIEALNAFWLSRLPLTADAVDMHGVPLEKLLKLHKWNVLDIKVKLTDKAHPVRLVAIRTSVEESTKRRREYRAKAKQKGKAVPKRTLIRAGWHLMVTNVPKEMLSSHKLAEIYSQRWMIEIVFRAWKQAGNLSKALNRTTSPQHLKALVLAGMIAMSISLKIGVAIARKHPDQRYSLEKIFDYIISRLVNLKNLCDIAKFKPDLRHLRGQNRTRKSLDLRLLELLG